MANSKEAPNLLTDDLSDALWGARENVSMRWPGLTKDEILTQIDECYTGEVVYRPWFDSEGNKAIGGAPCNKRIVIPAQNKYMQQIFELGLRMQDRGVPEGYEGT